VRLFARIRIVVTRAVAFFSEGTEFGEALRPALWSYTGFALAFDQANLGHRTTRRVSPSAPDAFTRPTASCCFIVSRFPDVAFSRATPSGLRRTRSMYRASTVSSSACI
jgi:hypothetical protein